MARPNHGHIFHKGEVPSDQIAGGTATTGYAPLSNGDGTSTWGAVSGGGVTYGTPAIVLGMAAAAGSIAEAIRRDSTIIAFDATVPVTQASADAAATGSAAVAARRDHRHGMPTLGGGGATDYATTAVIYDDLYYSSTAFVYSGGITQIASGTGANTSGAASGQGHPGVVNVATGTTATGRCGLGGGSVRLGADALTFGVVLRPGALSTSGQRYTIWAGLNNSGSGDGAEGVHFRYSDNVNSGNWQAVCRNGGTETAIDTGVAAAASWTKLGFTVNAAGTSVEFFINGTSVGTITTNIPTASTTTGQPINVIKSVGTTSSVTEVDAYWYIWTLGTAR